MPNKKNKKQSEQDKQTEPKSEERASIDRSEYNCPTCRGEGLINPQTVCDQCLGYGKV